jgi:hypothetical protein
MTDDEVRRIAAAVREIAGAARKQRTYKAGSVMD